MATFEEAVERIMLLNSEPSNEDKLKLYGLFKQTTVGDVNTECPSIFNVSGRAKWYAWNEQKGKSNVDAKTEYIELVYKLVLQHGIKDV